MTRIEEAIGRSESDWQRSVLQEWARRNPKPLQIKAGHLGMVDIVPTLCTCGRCRSPAIIIPDNKIKPARGFVLCPQCSQSTSGAVTK